MGCLFRASCPSKSTSTCTEARPSPVLGLHFSGYGVNEALNLPTWNFKHFTCRFEQWLESRESGKRGTRRFLGGGLFSFSNVRRSVTPEGTSESTTHRYHDQHMLRDPLEGSPFWSNAIARRKTMRKFVLLAAVLSLFSFSAAAQDYDFFGGYQFTHSDPNVNANGWNISVTEYANSWFGVTGDFSGAYNPGANLHTFMFGPISPQGRDCNPIRACPSRCCVPIRWRKRHGPLHGSGRRLGCQREPTLRGAACAG